MLERVINEQTGKLYTVIRVDDVRRTVSFFGSTAGEGGWRIAIVDAVDDLQREGANALLKVLEEPPARTLLLLVSHAPGRELPTIRSRCRRLLLRPLDAADVARAVAAATGRDADERGSAGSGRRRRRQRRRARSACSTARRWRCASACSSCSRSCPIPIRARCMRSATRSAAASRRRSPPSWTWSMAGCRRGSTATRAQVPRMARVAEAWEKVNRAAREVETYNLERKPLVFAVFGVLAEAARA